MDDVSKALPDTARGQPPGVAAGGASSPALAQLTENRMLNRMRN